MVKSYKHSLNSEQVNHFEQMADDWWDEAGPFRPLHQMNPCRLRFIKEHVALHFKKQSAAEQPLKGLTLLDVGCGGGLLCEPLARLGATVTGIDASPKAIRVAKDHADKMDLDITYQVKSVEEMQGQTFDMVLALEIIEHVDSPADFIRACRAVLSPQGLFFIATLNRTMAAYLGGIVAAEYILRWVPRGTHQWQRFVQPAELADWLRACDLKWRDLKGLRYNPLHRFSAVQQPWTLGPSLDINYIGCAVAGV